MSAHKASKSAKKRKAAPKPAKRTQKGRAATKVVTRPKRKSPLGPKGPSLLVLECDSEKLARQFLAIGSAVSELTGNWGEGPLGQSW